MYIARKLTLLVTATLFALSLPLMAAAVEISEIRIDQPGTDNDEYFELSGTANESLDGLSYIVIGDGATGCGTVESVTDLAGLSLDANGYFVAAEASFTLGTADLTTSLNFENSDNVTHLLVSNFTGASGDDLDTDDDGVLDVTPWTAEVSSVGLVENPVVDCANFVDGLYSSTLVGPDGSFVPGHVYLCEGTWQIGDFDLVEDTPGSANACPTAVEPKSWGSIKKELK